MDESSKLVILGTPAGGTTFIQRIFKDLYGLRIGHETLREDGIVCGFGVWRNWENRRIWDKESTDPVRCTARVIRNPVDVVPKLKNIMRGNREMNGVVQPCPWYHDDEDIRAFRYWTLTHERIEADHTLTIPSDPREYGKLYGLEPLLKDLELPVKDLSDVFTNKARHKDENTKQTIVWWHQHDPDFALRGMAIWDKYGK